MLNCIDLGVEFSGRYLFRNVNLNLLPKNRYSIVGANGAGKTTFLKILSHEDKPSDGVVDIPRKATVGILKQDHFRYEHQKVIDVVLDGKPELLQAFLDKEALLQSEHFGEEECVKLAYFEECIHRLDGYAAESAAQIILQGLGIPQAAHHGPLSALSGGFKLRVLLAQALFKNPDILLLDEPTNHLDITSIMWLEQFLCQEYQGLLIFISHDRQFINNVSNFILDVDYETITPYPGNYEDFIAKKAEVLSQLEKEIAGKQQQIAEMQAFVDRFKAKASKAKQAQSRMKMIEKIEITDLKNTSRIKPNFNFPMERPSGKVILQTQQLSHAYGDRILFMDLTFAIQRGQKLAVIGPNGVGKSTLLKLLLGQIPLTMGQFHWSEIIKIGYFAQDFHSSLDPNQTLLHWLCDKVSGAGEAAARKALGQMLFSGSDVNKTIKVLSGGECCRLIFAKLILEKCNVLVLDEPTNHLDLESIEGLADGLRNFAGTVLFVSHNRFLIRNVANHILAMDRETFEFYPGTYDEYMQKQNLLKQKK